MARDSLSPGDAGDHLTVRLMTMGPGQLVWERFGHNAIWISDARAGTELAYNYGIFDFDQVGFYPRLIEGEMLYRMEAHDALHVFEIERADGGDVARLVALAVDVPVVFELAGDVPQRLVDGRERRHAR